MLTTILLQAAKSAGGGMEGLIMIVAMIAIFYFLMIRPQNKKQKEIKRQREAMKTGDRVVTAGGIHGRLRDVKKWLRASLSRWTRPACSPPSRRPLPPRKRKKPRR